MKRIVAFPAPTFAAVHGACLGAGLGLALGCDVVYVADDAKIGSPFARIGAVLDSGGHSFFVSRLGTHRALELIYTGRLLSGIEAAQLGLVNRSMPKDSLVAETRKVAAQVAQGPTAAFMQSKRSGAQDRRRGDGSVRGAEMRSASARRGGQNCGLQGRHHGVPAKARAEVRRKVTRPGVGPAPDFGGY